MTLARVKGRAAYADIQPTMWDALMRGGGRIECATAGEAVRLVQRMNQCRILDRKLNNDAAMRRPMPIEHIDPIGYFKEKVKRDGLMYLISPYDDLIFKREDNVVIIEKRPAKPYVRYTDLAGNPIELEEAVIEQNNGIDTGESMPADTAGPLGLNRDC